MAKSPDNSTPNGDVSRETLRDGVRAIGVILLTVAALSLAVLGVMAWWPLLVIVWEFWT